MSSPFPRDFGQIVEGYNNNTLSDFKNPMSPEDFVKAVLTLNSPDELDILFTQG